MASFNKRRGSLAAVGLLVGGIALAGCGSSAGSSAQTSSGGGLPSTIKLLGIRDQTGPYAQSGIDASHGTALAIKEINDQHYLGPGVTLTVDEKDAALNPQTAAADLTSGLANGGITAVLGPMVSSEALAVAPIAQSKQVPIVFTQSGVDGLLTGDMEFRASADPKSLWPVAVDHMASTGVKKVAVVNTATDPTYNEIGSKLVPGLLGPKGITITKSVQLEMSVTDFQSTISQVVATDPDALVVTLVGPQVPTFMVELRQAGYNGPVYIPDAVTDAQRKSMGKAGDNLFSVADFSYASTSPTAKKFATAFKAQYSTEPVAFSAEAYDATWFVARAIKQAGSADPKAVAAALHQIGTQGFVGAQGQLSFENGDDATVAHGLLVGWDGTQQTIVSQ